VQVRQQWRETSADLWLRPPDQLRDFLHDWLQACLQTHDNHSARHVELSEDGVRRI
jgi:hypothetical protein